MRSRQRRTKPLGFAWNMAKESAVRRGDERPHHVAEARVAFGLELGDASNRRTQIGEPCAPSLELPYVPVRLPEHAARGFLHVSAQASEPAFRREEREVGVELLVGVADRSMAAECLRRGLLVRGERAAARAERSAIPRLRECLQPFVNLVPQLLELSRDSRSRGARASAVPRAA